MVHYKGVVATVANGGRSAGQGRNPNLFRLPHFGKGLVSCVKATRRISRHSTLEELGRRISLTLLDAPSSL